MGATVYSCPDELPEPDLGDFFGKNDRGVQAYFDACNEHLRKVAEWVKERSDSDLAGEIMHFPVADGKATYMVYTTSPLWLIHLNYGDGYMIDEMMLRGMRVKDVREKVRQEKALAEIFGRRE